MRRFTKAEVFQVRNAVLARRGQAEKRRNSVCILVCFLSLYFVGCSVPSSITSLIYSREDHTGRGLDPADGKEVVHPVTHPVPARLESGAAPQSEGEITPEHFLVHSVHGGQINALAVSREGLRAYSGGQDGKVVQSTLQGSSSGRYMQSQVILSGKKPILALALSLDEKKLAIAQFSSVWVYDLESRTITNRLSRVKGRILSIAWDPRGELLAFGRANGDVFVWNLVDGLHAGEDSFEALERYEGSLTPIVSLIFHPTGRALFVAERGGSILLWRLLRTESDLGLRDETVAADRVHEGRVRRRLAALPAEVEDLWLDLSGRVLFAASSDGSVYRYKVRGTKELEKIAAESSNVFSVQGLDLLPAPGQKRIRLLASSGKEQRIKFWCQTPPAALRHAAPAQEEAGAPGAQLFVAQSVLLRNPPAILRAGRGGPILWAAEKTGNLLTLDANSLVNSPPWVSRAIICRD